MDQPLRHALSLGGFLYALWLLLSGHYEFLLLALGFLSCILVVAIALRMDVLDHESHPIHLTLKLPLYWLWLLWEIAKANFAVAKLVWHPSLPLSPTMVRVKATQKTDLGRVIYANSITLTPGTVSMSLEGEYIDVHAITREMAQDLQTGLMDQRVTLVEGIE